MNYRFVGAKSGEELTVRVAGEGADAGDKAPYKAMTGALKYALLQSFLLATGDDPEDERADSRATLGSERVITPEQVRERSKSLMLRPSSFSPYPAQALISSSRSAIRIGRLSTMRPVTRPLESTPTRTVRSRKAGSV